MEANGSASFPVTAMNKDLTDTTTESALHCEPLESMKLAENSKLLGTDTMACALCYCPLIERMTGSPSRTSLVSYLYERGWRQLFALGGFPGLYKEFEQAKDYLKPAAGGVIVDASCGPGTFSRLFIKSKLYYQVVALDLSANMLRQCNKLIKKEKISDEALVMVKANISRLPFTANSIDAVHAGAALHCWPSPAKAVAEISRVLRPGGILVASTFLFDFLPLAIPAFRIARKYLDQFIGYKAFLSEDELEGLCKACGLVDFKCVRRGLYVMLSATKAT